MFRQLSLNTHSSTSASAEPPKGEQGPFFGDKYSSRKNSTGCFAERTIEFIKLFVSNVNHAVFRKSVAKEKQLRQQSNIHRDLEVFERSTVRSKLDTRPIMLPKY